MTPVTREEMYLYKLAGGSIMLPSPVSRKEMYLAKACGEAVTVPDPVSREEMYLYKLAGGSITLPAPVSRLELLMAAACGEAVTPYTPVSRIEWFWSQLVSPSQTITGVPPITFTSDGTALSSCVIYGNGQQTGTPSPDNIIMPTFCGNLVGSDWTIPITCGGQTTPIYLGQVQTTRRIKKLVLDGTEKWEQQSAASGLRFNVTVANAKQSDLQTVASICTHYSLTVSGGTYSKNNTYSINNAEKLYIRMDATTTLAQFLQFLVDQYAAGTPVTVWYALATPETGIVNEPLCKIGDYADELRCEDAGITIPTVSGSNTLTIGTTLQPSSVSITGHISQ